MKTNDILLGLSILGVGYIAMKKMQGPSAQNPIELGEYQTRAGKIDLSWLGPITSKEGENTVASATKAIRSALTDPAIADAVNALPSDLTPRQVAANLIAIGQSANAPAPSYNWNDPGMQPSAEYKAAYGR